MEETDSRTAVAEFRRRFFPPRARPNCAIRKINSTTAPLVILVFDAAERGPDEELKFQFEAVARMPNKEQEAIRTVLEAMIVKNQVAGVLEGVAKAGSR